MPNKLDFVIKKQTDPTDPRMQTNRVYKLSRNKCEASYIGETKREIYLRTQEHRNNLKKIENKFVISNHITDNPTQNFNFDAPDI